MKRIMLITIATSALFATGALADTQDTSPAAENGQSGEIPGMTFAEMDTNDDGFVTMKEYRAAYDKYVQSEQVGREHGEEQADKQKPEPVSHADLDLNGDGMVTAGEYLEAREKERASQR